jgi:hypothetical protein
MIDCDIACDDGESYSEYGLITAIMSKTNDVEDLTNIPFMQYADKTGFPMVWGAWSTMHENCEHTDAAIDPIEDGYYQWMYGIFDWYDSDVSIWKILIRYRDYKNHISQGQTTLTGSGNLQCPAVAVYNDQLVILAETDQNGNKDIICFYSDDGWLNFQSSFVTSELEDEMYPDIRHVKDLEFVCTFISENTLYMSTTQDGGATWTTPETIETDIVEEYKTSDLCEDAMYSIYECDNGVDCDLWMSTHKSQIEMPVWEIGDSWTYDFHTYTAPANLSQGMIFDGGGELTLEVTDDADGIYTIEGVAKPLQGTVDLPGAIGMKATRFTQYESTMHIYQSNLTIKDHESVMKGIVLLTLGGLVLPIPIQMQTAEMNIFKPANKVLPFPIYDGKDGHLPKAVLNQTWDTSLFWGIIPVSSGSVEIGWTGNASYEIREESITVPAGTYDVYNISSSVQFNEVGEDWYLSYYCEDLGNIVKCIYNLDHAEGHTGVLYEMELKSTTYTP